MSAYPVNNNPSMRTLGASNTLADWVYYDKPLWIYARESGGVGYIAIKNTYGQLTKFWFPALGGTGRVVMHPAGHTIETVLIRPCGFGVDLVMKWRAGAKETVYFASPRN